jgi:hypothetical protein
MKTGNKNGFSHGLFVYSAQLLGAPSIRVLREWVGALEPRRRPFQFMLDLGLHSALAKNSVSQRSRVQLSCSRIAYLAHTVVFFKNSSFIFNNIRNLFCAKSTNMYPFFLGIRCIPNAHADHEKIVHKKSVFSTAFGDVLPAPETSFQPPI